MNCLLKNGAFHHIEVPCDNLDLAERFYASVFGAQVYMRRDESRRSDVPATGTIAEAESIGFHIDGTYLKIGSDFRIGFLKRQSQHEQREIDHLAFTIDESDLAALGRLLSEKQVEVIDQTQSRMLIRDPFGMALELWPRSVLQQMGLL